MEDGALNVTYLNHARVFGHGWNKSEQQALLEDIAYFEARLEQMGHLGDCAYEKAMARFYEALVAQKRQSLAELEAGRTVSA